MTSSANQYLYPSGPVNPYASASLYVGDLRDDVTEAVLFELFNAVGPVASIRVCRDAQTRKSLGYAYVNFHSVADAERALDTMNFTQIHDRVCRIMWSQRDPSLRKTGKGNIFVKNLHPNIDNKTLYDTFSVFGNILSCKVMRDDKQKSLGYGYVHYAQEDSSQKAINGVNGMVIHELTVCVEPFKPREKRDTKSVFTNIYVKNYPQQWNEQELINFFETETQGKVTSASITGHTRGKYAFLNFKSNEDAAKAVELNGRKVESYDLYVSRAQKKNERSKYLRRRYRSPSRRTYQGVNLYVKNIHPDVDDIKLRAMFSEYGMITSARVMLDQRTRRSRGFGFVCFEKKEDATRALAEMNSKIIDGKPLYVSRAQRKIHRQAWLQRQQQARLRPRHIPFYPQPMPHQMRMGPYGMPGGFPRPSYRPPHMFPPPPPPQMMWPQQQPFMPRGMMPQTPTTYPIPRPLASYPISQPPQAPQAPIGSASVVSGGYSATNSQVSGPNTNVEKPPLTANMLAATKPAEQKRLIGERLFPRIQMVEPRLAGKITGMLLEMDNTELLYLLESNDALMNKIKEALQVLKEHNQEKKGTE